MKKSEEPEEAPNSEDLGIDESSNPNIKEKSIFPRIRKQVMKDKKPITQQMLFMRRQEWKRTKLQRFVGQCNVTEIGDELLSISTVIVAFRKACKI